MRENKELLPYVVSKGILLKKSKRLSLDTSACINTGLSKEQMLSKQELNEYREYVSLSYT